MKKTMHYLMAIPLVSSFLLIGVVAYWLLYPYNVISFRYDRLPILNENHVVHRGETLLWQGDHEHYTKNIEVNVSRQIVCDTLINLPNTSYVTKKGRFVAVNSSVVIPLNTALGTCYVDIVSQWSINPIRKITIENKTEEFTVVK